MVVDFFGSFFVLRPLQSRHCELNMMTSTFYRYCLMCHWVVVPFDFPGFGVSDGVYL